MPAPAVYDPETLSVGIFGRPHGLTGEIVSEEAETSEAIHAAAHPGRHAAAETAAAAAGASDESSADAAGSHT